VIHRTLDDQTRFSSGTLVAELAEPGQTAAQCYEPLEPDLQQSTGRLRIAIVSPEIGAGAGVPHYWQALASVMSLRHEVHVFTAKANRGSLEGIEVHRVRAIRAGWFLLHLTFYITVLAQFWLARLLRREPFDLVLGIGALTPFADVATVHFVQAREIELQERGLFPQDRAVAGFAKLDYGLYSHTMGWMGRNFYRRSETRIVAISESVKHDLVRFEGASTNAITVVPNGVDIERFHPANREFFRVETRKELGLDDDQVAVLFVGNSWGRKGLCTAIEAIRDQTNVCLVVVGDGVPDVFTKHLSPELASRILFTGKQHDKVERYFAAADIFILPTLYEPFGLVILEALASGLPSIVSASAGASEWLIDGVDALLLKDPLDGDEARTALLSILTNPEVAAGLSENGRRKAEELQWGTVAERIIGTRRIRLRANRKLPKPGPTTELQLGAK
jgi:UDP-glucose:(heptosyl)LPS alpha-1,3-glucosyltransferase